jgi:hypothetical protein
MQDTGLNMWLLLAILLPIANVILLLTLFFIPPNCREPVLGTANVNLGFKTIFGLVFALFIIIMLIMIGPKFIEF